MRKTIVPKFNLPLARLLRSQFDDRFSDPKRVGGERFVWDYWNVPGQYTLLRTPIEAVFEPQSVKQLEDALREYGAKHLGCSEISPLWLSCYVEGCRQNFHADLPHGPWAFVFSLTEWSSRRFTGGETVLLADSVLDYWGGAESNRARQAGAGLEEAQVLERVAPEFSQLTVFDPKIPHGVEQVRGVHDVCEGRLVVHGWFTQPAPMWTDPKGKRGAWTRDMLKTLGTLNAALEPALTLESGAGVELCGMLAVEFAIGADGALAKSKVLSDTLRVVGASRHTVSDEQARGAIIRALAGWAKGFRFAKARGKVVLPLVFEG